MFLYNFCLTFSIMFKMKFISVLWILFGLSSVHSNYELSVAHLNDIHSYFFESTAKGLRCTKNDIDKGLCFGGIARQVTKIKEIRSKEKNVLVLASGDFYLADSYYPLHGWKLASALLPYLTLNATSLGNHDFDQSMFETAAYILTLKCPVVACNLIGRNGSFWQDHVNKSIVLNVGGQDIGIIGYISPETKYWSLIGKSLRIEDEIPCLQKEVKKLTDMGVNKIIAIGHSGYHMDKNIAKMVPGIDVIVGGNSDLFIETPTGLEVLEEDEQQFDNSYPTVIQNNETSAAPGGVTLVVQVPQHGRHVGHLKVVFDDKGRVLNYSGSPILLDRSVQPDPETEAKLNKSIATLENVRNWRHIPGYDEVLGYTPVELEGHHKECRMRECSLGNMLTDAMVNAFLNHQLGKKNVDAAVWNSGSIRSSIMPGNITFRDLSYAVYLGGRVAVQDLTGTQLKDMLEKAVAKYDSTGISPPGSFLQVSRLRVEFDLRRPVGHRVVALQIICSSCNDSKYQATEGTEHYNVAMPNYFLRGGDGFFKHHGVRYNVHDVTDALAIAQYLKDFQPTGQLEGRITFRETNDDNKPTHRRRHAESKHFEFSLLKHELAAEHKKERKHSNDTTTKPHNEGNSERPHFQPSTNDQKTTRETTTYLASENVSATVTPDTAGISNSTRFEKKVGNVSQCLKDCDLNHSGGAISISSNSSEINFQPGKEGVSFQPRNKDWQELDEVGQHVSNDEQQKENIEVTGTEIEKILSSTANATAFLTTSENSTSSTEYTKITSKSETNSKDNKHLHGEVMIDELRKKSVVETTTSVFDKELMGIFRDDIKVETNNNSVVTQRSQSTHNLTTLTDAESTSFAFIDHDFANTSVPHAVHNDSHSLGGRDDHGSIHHMEEHSTHHFNPSSFSSTGPSSNSSVSKLSSIHHMGEHSTHRSTSSSFSSTGRSLNSSVSELSTTTEEEHHQNSTEGEHDAYETMANLNKKTQRPSTSLHLSHKTLKKDLSAQTYAILPSLQEAPHLYPIPYLDWFQWGSVKDMMMNNKTSNSSEKQSKNTTASEDGLQGRTSTEQFDKMPTGVHPQNVTSDKECNSTDAENGQMKVNSTEKSAENQTKKEIGETVSKNTTVEKTTTGIGESTPKCNVTCDTTKSLNTTKVPFPDSPTSKKSRNVRHVPAVNSFWNTFLHLFH